ncbi:MAG: hypothetical protein HQL20_02175 [Candidatus Omnitrophica bacterium]|nr:hypothetical protein [Candidatus Omnitrophota bacterium]
MTPLPRFGKLLFNNKGGWLVELAVALVIAGMFVGGLASLAKVQLNAARARHTLTTMRSILKAGQDYRVLHGVWPADIKEVEALLASSVGKNAWGGLFWLSHSEGLAWVETDVPSGVAVPQGPWTAVYVSGIGAGSRWRMSTPLSYGFTARLVYETK